MPVFSSGLDQISFVTVCTEVATGWQESGRISGRIFGQILEN